MLHQYEQQYLQHHPYQQQLLDQQASPSSSSSAPLDDDIYSIERLQPAPPKPPKPSKKLAPHDVSKPPSSTTVSLPPTVLERSLSVQDEATITRSNGKNVTTRLASNPVTATETRLATLLERDSLCTVTINRCSSDIEMQGLQSATSSSLMHGIILVVVMLTSLAAFVCSKLRDACEDFYLVDVPECSHLPSVFFSVINILSCLYSFTVYFLHLIGQCDYISWSARRKVTLEILFTLTMVVSLSLATLFLLTKTTATYNPVSMVAAVFSIIAVLLYCLRTGLLLREIRMLWSKPDPSRKGSMISRKMSVDAGSKRGSAAAEKSSSRKWSTSRGSSMRTSVTSAQGISSSKRKQSLRQNVSKDSTSFTVNDHQHNDTGSNELEDDVFLD